MAGAPCPDAGQSHPLEFPLKAWGGSRGCMADDDPTRRVDLGNLPTVRGLKAGLRLFGRYVLETELGAGGMGVVWRARDAELDELVALKFLPEVVARDDAAVDELKDETRMPGG